MIQVLKNTIQYGRTQIYNTIMAMYGENTNLQYNYGHVWREHKFWLADGGGCKWEGGLKPPDFLANIIIWGCGHAKVAW